MKLATYSEGGSEARLGLVKGDEIICLDEGAASRPDRMINFIRAGSAGLDWVRQAALGGKAVSLSSITLLAPIAQPPEFIGVGLNYRDHALEAKMELPTAPLFFNKQTSCVAGPHDHIVLPRLSNQLDYEGELGIVIGTAGRYLSRQEAAAAIFGYTVVNDISVRDWQLRSPTHTIGKSFDSHGPFGPWIVTADELTDPHNLTITTKVNEETRQRGNTAEMVFDCFSIVAFLSQVMTLRPGTIVTTGTPAGVAFGRDPAPYLRVGDLVTVEIEKLGRLANRVVAEGGHGT